MITSPILALISKLLIFKEEIKLLDFLLIAKMDSTLSRLFVRFQMNPVNFKIANFHDVPYGS